MLHNHLHVNSRHGNYLVLTQTNKHTHTQNEENNLWEGIRVWRLKLCNVIRWSFQVPTFNRNVSDNVKTLSPFVQLILCAAWIRGDAFFFFHVT